jgi:hypothetical protein
MSRADSVHEASPFGAPLRNLGLTLKGTWLEPVIAEFLREIEHRGIRRVTPTFYLSNEWGVSDSLAIGIPFYLARPDLMALQAKHVGHVEGGTRAELLQYLRHEMGHVICYAYRLYDDEEWIGQFGSNTQPYVEEYRAEPFSRRFVRHLPGWYAQKHPEEDWCETFAVWMTPGVDWRREYATWPVALAKLEYCDRTMARLADREPLATSTRREDDISEYELSLDEFYDRIGGERHQVLSLGEIELPRGLDGAIKAIFEDHDKVAQFADESEVIPASSLILRLELDLLANIYRWTGHFPERARPLIRYLAERADQLKQVCVKAQEPAATIALTALLTTLAMNHVHGGKYLP